MRALALTLALVTSPLGAAVCEFVCADHAVTGHHAAPVAEVPTPTLATPAVNGHAHHGMAPVATEQVASVVPASTSAFVNLMSDCASPVGVPATIRTTVTPRVDLSAAVAITTAVYVPNLARHHLGGPTGCSPPPPLLHAAIPLRI